MNLKQFFKHGKWHKSTLLLVSALLLGCLVIGGTVALLVTDTDPITNIFTPSSVSTQVVETLKDGVKSDVKIRNTGSTDAYIRAAVIVTWQNADGQVYGRAPVKDTDYVIAFGSDWTLAVDGFYYWSDPVAASAETGVLIASCQPVEGKAPDGYTLHVEILGSGVQSVPTTVVSEVWSSEKVTVSVEDSKKLTVAAKEGGAQS